MSATDRPRRKSVRGGVADDGAKTPPASRRRTQAERSEATRKLILDAAIRIIARKGAAGLRTGEVAEEAGVSVGAQLHHFPTKHELIHAAFDFVNERSVQMSEQRAKFAARARNPEAIVDAIVADASEFFFGNGFHIEFALVFGHSDVGLSRTVRRASRRSRFQVEAIWEKTLESRGFPPGIAGDILALTLSIVRGFATRRFLEDDPARRARLVGVWRDMIRDYLAAQLTEQQMARIFAEPADDALQEIAAAKTVPLLSASNGVSRTPSKNRRARKEV